MTGLFGRVFLALSISLMTVGCGIEIYGSADRYDQHKKPGFAVEIPPNAPYISEQFVSGDDVGDKNHLGIDIWGKRGSEVIAAAAGRAGGLKDRIMNRPLATRSFWTTDWTRTDQG